MAVREQSPDISRLLVKQSGMYLLAVSLAAALLAERRVLARRGWAGEIVGILSSLSATSGVSATPYSGTNSELAPS